MILRWIAFLCVCVFGIGCDKKPSEELISSSIGFSMLLEQLINALAELEEQGLQLNQSNALVEDYTVFIDEFL